MCSRAPAQGLDLSDMDAVTLSTSSGDPFRMCVNCRTWFVGNVNRVLSRYGMTYATLDAHSGRMQRVITRCLWVRQFEYRAADVLLRYGEAGYSPTEALHDFIERYAEMRFIWPYGERIEVELTTDVERALLIPRSNIEYAENRCNTTLVPVGEIFETLDGFVLGADGNFYIVGDAGIQRIPGRFDDALLALVGDDWDKTNIAGR